MTATKAGELFDLAVLLNEEQRGQLCDLAELGSPGSGQRLQGQLQKFDNFQKLLDQEGVLPEMLARLKKRSPDLHEEMTIGSTPVKKGRTRTIRDPPQLDHYQIEREIKSGGQGTVYQARQETTGRRVAVKLIHSGASLNPDFRARFQREFKLLAMLNHDHIAAIYDAGTTPQGIPYFAMEYVPGSNILSYCRDSGLSQPQRLALFIQVCEGIAHAHQRLILHRDLKPGNLLVAEIDGQPQVKIVDFGIGRSLDENAGAGENLTQMGPLGTPGYMAPEVFGTTEPDTRLDIYSLGVLLYHMVTGKAPLNPPDQLSLDEKLRYYREHEPTNPSTYLAGKQSKDLDAIILKAMAKDPNRRYASVNEMERDCRLLLQGRPVTARAPSPFYLLGRFLARNKITVTAAGLVLLSLILGLASSIISERKAKQERRRFETSFETLEDFLTTPDPYRMGVQARVIDVLRTREFDFEQRFAQDRELESMIRGVWGRTYYGLGFYTEARAHLERTVAIRSRDHGPADPRTLSARYLLANASIRQGRYDEAETAFRQIYARYPDAGFNQEKLRVLAGLADVFQAKNLPQLAKPLLQQMERHLLVGVDEPARAHGLFSLANIHHGLGNPEAESLYRQALAILDTIEESTPQALSVMSSLANHLRRTDRLTEAEQLYRRLIKERAQRLGEGHYLTQYARAGLALCLLDQQLYGEAERLITAVADTLKRRDASHPSTLVVIRIMASVLKNSGKKGEALGLLQELVTYYQQNELTRSPGALKARSNLADLFSETGAHDRAVELLGGIIDDSSAVMGQGHLTTTTAMMTLGQTYENMEDRERAEETYQQAVRLLMDSRPDSRELPYYQAIRANNLTGMQRYEEAETILLQCLAALPSGSAFHDEVRTYIVRHFQARGDETRAAAYERP